MPSPDDIIQRVLARFKSAATDKSGMARATLVVDENVAFLVAPLKEANFRVLTPTKGLLDPDIKETLLSHRILVTKNTKDFLSDAPVFDYGIIGLEALPFLDPSAAYKDNQTAKMISKAISDLNLVSLKSGFVVMLHPNGQHKLKHIG